MLELLGKRQQELLRLFQKNRAGLSIDELAAALGITRTAVRQHLAALEAEGYVAKGEERKTAGRPGRSYCLTPKGLALFPRQYSWFSGVLLEAVRAERGSEGLAEWLRSIAGPLAESLAPRLAGKQGQARLDEVLRIMDELAFEARLVDEPERFGARAIEASNCIYHELAAKHPEVCQLDLVLLGRLTGAELHHQECIVRGGSVCRFVLGS